MSRRPFLALGALALVAAAGPSTDPRDGRVAGKPERCVIVDQTSALTVLDERTLILRPNGKRMWINTPPGCFPLRPNDTLILEMWGGGGQLCQNDRFRTITPGMSIPSGPCRLGQFVPYDKVK